MALLDPGRLRRNVIAIGGTGRVAFTNTSDRPIPVSVHPREGRAWRPRGERVVLAPGSCWSAGRAEPGGRPVLVVAARDGGRAAARGER